MQGNLKRAYLILVLGMAIVGQLVFSQDGVDTQVGAGSGGEAVAPADSPLLPEAESAKLDPVFPAESTALILFEAEDAVSTNFAKEPTLNYSASGFRTLQLNRYTALSGGDPFIAEFVFYVDQPGSYEFWYGGSPPGPREDVFPSYASPFRYSLDEGPEIPVYREDVHVSQAYAPSYYWVSVAPMELDAGIHTLRLTVAEKRRFDGKFYLFLDSLFLVDRERFARDGVEPPRVFPSTLEATGIDEPFRSINDYEYLITQDQDDPDVYIELSLIYSLIGDFNSALKYLSRAALIDPGNPEIQLLTAKNRIWKGDAAEGLRAYERMLQLDPSQIDIWAEAGKVSAWIGEYRDSIGFYQSGIQSHPDDLNLIVNLGITYLWENQGDQASALFSRAEDIAFTSASAVSDLGEIYMVNGYPDIAISTFRAGIRAFPEYLALYLKLEEAYAEIGRIDDAEVIHAQIADRFVGSDKLSAYLDTFSIKQSMKDEVIAGYQRRLELDPDNLDLRELLVQTYFWNGLRQRAIDEYLSILTNYAYRAFIDFDRRNVGLLGALDELYLRKRFYRNIADAAPELRKFLNDSLTLYNAAFRVYERYLKQVAAAKEKGENPPEVEGDHPGEVLARAENELADILRRVERFFDWKRLTEDSLVPGDTITEPFLIEEQKDREAFNQVVSALAWEWNRRATVTELETVSSAGVVLGDHVLSRMNLIEGDIATAVVYADRALSPTYLPEETVFTLSQARLWGESSGTAVPYLPEERLAEFVPYIVDVNALSRLLSIPEDSVTGLFTDTTPERAREAIAELGGVPRAVAPPIDAVDDNLELLHGVLENRMARLWFQIDQDTYLLRFELGDYYLLEKQYRPAIDEFRKVLAIDPWNTSATYKLGTLHQLAGDWRRAMEKYRQVYYADPRFENVAGSYNHLARLYADSLGFEHYLMADSSVISNHTQARFTNSLTGALGLDFRVASDTIRRYQAFGGIRPGIYQRIRADLSVPVSLSAIQTRIVPIAGIDLSPTLISGRIGSASEAANPLEILETYDIYPVLGADIGVNAGPVYVGGVYRYEPVAETMFPDRSLARSHRGEVNAVISFGFLGIPVLQYSSARTYGKLDFRLHDDDSTNALFAVAQDLNQVFHLADSPWTNLTVSASVIYEHARDPSVDIYYSPRHVFTSKGSVGIASWIGIPDGNVLGLSFRLDAGYYASGFLQSDVSGSLLAESEIRGEFTKGDSTYYMSLVGSATFGALALPAYWSGYLRMGYTAKLPRLLAE